MSSDFSLVGSLSDWNIGFKSLEAEGHCSSESIDSAKKLQKFKTVNI